MFHEIEHYYGSHVHLLNSPLLHGLLADLCASETVQPRINQLVTDLYERLLDYVVDREFSVGPFSSSTRMTERHPEARVLGTRVLPQQRVICVDVARAGIIPSAVCYTNLHKYLQPDLIRQDHIFSSRTTGVDDEHVVGSEISACKIGGPKDGALLLIPDPMGATGNTVMATLEHYKQHVSGKWQKVLALHLIVTPEYLRAVQKAHPDLIIYAIRLDRGLSPQAVLNTTPGLHWDQEKGLNDADYIVPGGGGFGEIMNNSFC
ncbi:MAG: uracil phosphoribosyltransferase [Bdellovibrio sp.]|nr:MAG: uracil phosphoribosyltransferase [Bdellovibrio sp.]